MQGVTPWDLGQPTPVILHLHQTGALPKGRALVPGCGTVSFDPWVNLIFFASFELLPVNITHFSLSTHVF